MIKTVSRLIAVALTSACAVPAYAAPVTYNITLTGSPGQAYSGTGSITLAYAPSATTLTTYAASDVSNLSFSIGGQTFTAPPGTLGPVQFLNGQLSALLFSQQIGTSPNRYSLQTTSAYSFGYNNLLSVSTGTLSATLAPNSAVPEPASWAMMILGMGAVGYAMRRKVRASEVRFDAKIKRMTAGAAA